MDRVAQLDTAVRYLHALLREAPGDPAKQTDLAEALAKTIPLTLSNATLRQACWLAVNTALALCIKLCPEITPCPPD